MGCGASAKTATVVPTSPDEKPEGPQRKSNRPGVSDEIVVSKGSIRCAAKLRRSDDISEDYFINNDKICGTGFAGPVLLCTNRSNGKVCAVKSYNKKAKTPRQFEMLRNEVEVYLKLDHPHIARLFDVYEASEELHLVMEYCAGGELYHRLVKKSGYNESMSADATHQMLTAINYLHTRAKVVHRDLKLENWLYATEEETAALKLIDFGFSKAWEAGGSNNMQQACGSLPYAAPELLLRNYTNKCDMWSLGVIVFMMLSGEPPFFSSRGEDAVKNKILNGQYNMRPEKWKKISWKAGHFVASLLTVDAEQRLDSVKALEHPFVKERTPTSESDSAPIDVDVVKGLRDFMTHSQLKRAAMCMMAYSLSSKEIQEFEAMFKQLDVNHTGMISLKDFVSTMKENLIISNTEMTRMFETMDLDGAGELSYTQFVAALVQTRVDMHGDVVRDVFERFDTSRSGSLGLEDLKRVLGQNGYEGTAEQLLEEVGLPPDGRIDYEMFVKIMTTTEAAKASNRMLDDGPNGRDRSSSMVRQAMGQMGARMSKDATEFGAISKTMVETPEMLEFEAKLRKGGVEVEKFGVGDAKSISDLFWEVQKSECVMGMQKGVFKRFLDVLRVELWADVDGVPRTLMEKDQALQDGRTRERSKPLSKKMSVGENWEDALRRAFASELGLDGKWQATHLQFQKRGESQNERESVGYPGIKTVYKFHNVHGKVVDPNHADCEIIGLPNGSDFFTEELSVVGTDRRHFWTWSFETVANLTSITSASSVGLMGGLRQSSMSVVSISNVIGRNST